MKEERKDIIIPFIAVIYALGLILFFSWRSPFIYETNDDLFLKWIASGEITGEPDAMLFHIGYPAGLFLSALYGMFPHGPWYGLFQVTAMGAVVAVVMCGILSAAERFWVKAISLIAGAFCIYGFFFMHIAELQFTFTAAFLGAGAIFAYGMSGYFADDRKKHALWSICFWVLVLWSATVRLNAFLMLIPFLGVIGIMGMWEKRNKNGLLISGLIAAGIVLAVILINRIAYGSAEWKEFDVLSSSRSEIADYYQYPDYGTHSDVYAKYGIGPAAYEALSHHYLMVLNPGVDAGSLSELASIAKAEHEVPPISHYLWTFWDRHFVSYMDRPFNILVYALYLLCVVVALIARRRRMLGETILVIFARMVVWGYLVYNERLPIRVTHGVYAAELVCLLLILLKMQRSIGRRSSFVLFLSVILVVTGLSVRFGIPKTRAVEYDARSKAETGEIFTEVREYFSDHPDQIFLLDVHSFEYYTENALTGRLKDGDNWLLLGGWVAKSPWFEKKFDKLGIEDPDNCFFTARNVKAVFLNVSGDEYDYFEDFCRERYPDKQVYVEDIIHTSGGLEFAVLGCE